MRNTNLLRIKEIPILDIAKQLGIKVRGNKAMCFNGHDDKTPSLCFSENKNLWKCFGCDAGGDNINLVMGVHQCDFKTALEWLSHFYNIDTSYNHSYRSSKYSLRNKLLYKKKTENASTIMNLYSVDSEVYAWLHGNCGKVKNMVGINYLNKHGISEDVAYKYGIRELEDSKKAFRSLIANFGTKRVFQCGIAWGKNTTPERLIWSTYSLIIPFFENEKIVYLQGRLFNTHPKYLNLQGIQKPLYNSWCLSQLPKGSTVHVCEGVPDVLALATKQVPAIGVLGATSFRKEWIDSFVPFNVVLLPDGDNGGVIFQKKIEHLFRERGKSVSSVNLPPGKDVSDVIAELDGAN
jgi:DNA primase